MVETAFVDEDRFLLSADGVTNRYPIHLVFLINMVKQSANFIVDYRFPLPFRSAVLIVTKCLTVTVLGCLHPHAAHMHHVIVLGMQ